MKYGEIVDGVLGDKWIRTLDQYFAETEVQKGSRNLAIEHIESNLRWASERMDDRPKSEIINRRLAAWLAAREDKHD